jgi:hypothetical protein
MSAEWCPHGENRKVNGKEGYAWETRARRIRKRVRSRTLKSRNKRKKRSRRSSRNEALDNKDCKVSGDVLMAHEEMS